MKIKNDKQFVEVVTAAVEYLESKHNRYILFMKHGNDMALNGVLASAPVEVYGITVLRDCFACKENGRKL